ncbi:MAG: tRNA epoxyqueuosine(34) reductase QueG [Alphaproteobacteria bacterium]|nr:tRNA epoxyqueuosine(34) reductase QueG [Alphaproteobacteria bacterium]
MTLWPQCQLRPLTLILISELTRAVKAKALDLGFDDVRVTKAQLPEIKGEELSAFVGAGHHGDMSWMAETLERRKSPDAMYAEAKTAIVLAVNYDQGLDHAARLSQASTGVISTYALNRDYHDLIKQRLKILAGWIAKETGADVKVFVDTAPLMEKPLAAQAGLGWQGKHTNLVSRKLGSWFFIGSILTTAELECDAPESDHCGSCTACLQACPTQAFTGPHQIDARRCISYLTIEHQGEIPQEFRKAIGNRIYGCDDCLAVCPWNKFAESSREIKLQARPELVSPALTDLLTLDDATFRKVFSGSPVKRIGRDRFIRNCLIAAGNSGDQSLVPLVSSLCEDTAQVVRNTAQWAMQELTRTHQ